jgi:hypothetical protein
MRAVLTSLAGILPLSRGRNEDGVIKSIEMQLSWKEAAFSLAHWVFTL